MLCYHIHQQYIHVILRLLLWIMLEHFKLLHKKGKIYYFGEQICTFYEILLYLKKIMNANK